MTLLALFIQKVYKTIRKPPSVYNLVTPIMISKHYIPIKRNEPLGDRADPKHEVGNV